jgi:hypothetical protein
VERLLTWLVCGPIGHLVAGVLDWAELLGRYVWARARRRGVDPWARPPETGGRTGGPAV